MKVFESLQISNNSKSFGNILLLYFAKKHTYSYSNIMIVKNEKLLVKNDKLQKLLINIFLQM